MKNSFTSSLVNVLKHVPLKRDSILLLTEGRAETEDVHVAEPHLSHIQGSGLTLQETLHLLPKLWRAFIEIKGQRLLSSKVEVMMNSLRRQAQVVFSLKVRHLSGCTRSEAWMPINLSSHKSHYLLRHMSTDSAKNTQNGDSKSSQEKHRDAEKEPLPEWPEGINPHTGEKGGPKGPEPTRYRDWERKGRVSDF